MVLRTSHSILHHGRVLLFIIGVAFIISAKSLYAQSVIPAGKLDEGFGGYENGNGRAISLEDAYSANAIAMDPQFLYIVGENVALPSWNFSWRIEKRTASDASFDLGFGNNGVINGDASSPTANAIAIDSKFMYVAGGSNYTIRVKMPNWRIEKRSLATGALDPSFGIGGVAVGDVSSTRIQDMAIDDKFMYIVGSSDLSLGKNNWRVEKRSLATGELDKSFGDGGVVSGSMSNLFAYRIVSDDRNSQYATHSKYVYIFGSRNTTSHDDDDTFIVEKRLKSDGSLVKDFGNSGVVTGGHFNPADMVIDSDFIYLAGGKTTWGYRIEKRSLATGKLDPNFGDGGAITNTSHEKNPVALVLPPWSDYLYIVGMRVKNSGGTESEQFVERRRTDTGAFDPRFGTGGVAAGGMGWPKRATADFKYLYIVGGAVGGTSGLHWYAEKMSFGDTWDITTAKRNVPFLASSSAPAVILRNLSIGSFNDDVKTLQTILVKEGVYPERRITGYFGQLTSAAVKRFQTKYGIEAAGIVGPRTKAKLNQLRGIVASGAPSSASNQSITQENLQGIWLIDLGIYGSLRADGGYAQFRGNMICPQGLIMESFDLIACPPHQDGNHHDRGSFPFTISDNNVVFDFDGRQFVWQLSRRDDKLEVVKNYEIDAKEIYAPDARDTWIYSASGTPVQPVKIQTLVGENFFAKPASPEKHILTKCDDSLIAEVNRINTGKYAESNYNTAVKVVAQCKLLQQYGTYQNASSGTP